MKKLLLALLAVSAVGLVAAPARAFVPQTITIDGVNDFDPANLLGDDSNDTQQGCSPVALPMDLGKIYVTNDANYLYVGIEFARTCYCDMNLGMAMDVGNTAAGGSTDPFGRKIGWASVPFKPEWVVYDVTPTDCNTFNYEILYRDSLGTIWNNKSTQVNPSWGSGSNGLGIADNTNFREIKLPLSVLGTPAGTHLNFEFWVTQEGSTKGPLDAFCSDGVQMSHGGTTTYDTTAVVQMTCMVPYTVLSAIDNIPPTVTSAQAVNFAVLSNKQFSLASNKVDVTFSESVDATTAQTTGNYAFSGPVSRTIVGAVRDAVANNLVHLTLNSAIQSNAAFYNITVINVKDLANNAIASNGTTNVGSFFIQNVEFDDNVRLRLCKGEFATTDSFYVEGSILPLTFTVGDNGRELDANSDSIYTVTVPFCMPKDRGTGKAEADLEWKFSHTPSGDAFEPGANRTYHLTSDSGAVRTVAASWANDDPSSFTSKPIDVVFKVNANAPYVPAGGPNPHHLWLVGSSAPLGFTRPGIPMLDNGVAPDQTSGDKIYTVRVRFPRCTPKDLTWKVVYDSTAADTVYECTGQGDRDLFLNDAVFDTTNDLVLPARGLDRCQIVDKAVAVTFRVQMGSVSPLAGAADTVAVMGGHSPSVTGPAFAFPLHAGPPPAATARLFDNGLAPDAHSGDGVFTRTIVFPESTGVNVNFKYWLQRFTNGGYECEGAGDRSLKLDDVNHSSGNPMLRNVDLFNNCQDLADVGPFIPNPADAVAQFGVLRQSFPNPASARLSIQFELKRAGRVSLRVFDVSGRHVTTLVDRALEAGPHQSLWNGRDDDGHRVASGVYVYELAMGAERLTRRMVVTQ